MRLRAIGIIRYLRHQVGDGFPQEFRKHYNSRKISAFTIGSFSVLRWVLIWQIKAIAIVVIDLIRPFTNQQSEKVSS